MTRHFSLAAGGNAKRCQGFGGQGGGFPTKLGALLQFHPATAPLGIHPKGLKTYVHTKTRTRCLSRLHSRLPKLDSIQNAPKCTDEPWGIQTTDCHSALKRNELSSHENTGKNLKGILPSERIQPGKATPCTIPTRTFQKRQDPGDGKKISGFQGLRGKKG